MSIALIAATVDLLNTKLKAMEEKVATVQAMKGDKGDQGETGKEGKAGKDGKDGLKGDTGAAGKDGKDGVDGLDGISVVDAVVDFDGHLVLTLSDGNELDAGDLTDVWTKSEKIVQIIRGGGSGGPALDNEQIDRQFVAIGGRLDSLESRADETDTEQATQDQRLTDIEAVTDGIDVEQQEQNDRLDSLESRADETDTEQLVQDDRLTDLEARLNQLEFIPLSIPSFSVSPSVFVLGDTATSLTFNFSVAGNPLENLVTSINRGIGEVTSPTTQAVSITNTTTYTLTASADNQTTRTRNATVSFLNRVYFFTSDDEVITDETITSGANFVTGNRRRTFTYNASPAGSFLCTAYPVRLGLHQDIQVNNLPNNDFEITTRAFTNDKGFTEDYYVYRSNNKSFGQGIVVNWR